MSARLGGRGQGFSGGDEWPGLRVRDVGRKPGPGARLALLASISS